LSAPYYVVYGMGMFVPCTIEEEKKKREKYNGKLWFVHILNQEGKRDVK
jgi:Na+-transporting methylmalonyl-CoA/oxaloacetate decarboxylase gamma subunit